MADLLEKALLLHEKMLESPLGTFFSQDELQKLVDISKPADLLIVAQELINLKFLKLSKAGDELRFQALTTSEVSKISSMNDDESMIYSYIEASAREGIWTKTLKAKTNLHQHVVIRCLKSLENQRYIKSIKSVKHPTRKIYMLYNLQPSIEVTGGPWFTDSELDTEFIDSLLTVIWRFIASKTFPTTLQQPTENINIIQAVYPTNHTGFVELDAIMDFIIQNKITNIDLGISDIRSLCDVLIFDDKLELVKSTNDTYKATWQSVLEAGFGNNWREDSMNHMVNMTFKNELLQRPLSIFDHYAAIEDIEENDDTVFLDSWINN